MAALLDSHDNFVVHDWIEDPSNTVEVGSTENVSTDESGGSPDNKRRPVWTRESTHWLMEEMRQFEMREEKHQIKKRAVYEELADRFSEANFNIHWEAIQKKWQNLMSTYWRNLKKPKKAGQWEYFTEMDNILRNTTVWVGLNGCKDPNASTSLYYSDDSDSRLWSTERILMMLEDMQQLEKGDEHKGRRNVFHKVATNFQRCGHAIDWKAVQKKWHNLMSTYKRNVRKPREEVIWEYFDAMDSVTRKIPAYYRCTVADSNELSVPTIYEVSKAHSEEESVWTHDNTLWLLEEMLAVKERRDKHLLKNRVVFREIADTFNAERFDVDWKQVLKKWQAMYIMYSKILRGVVQPGNWQYFERMHSIVGDTDMYVGVGAKKQEDEEKVYPESTETVYHYINPEDNSQYILTSCQSAAAAAANCKNIEQDLTDNLTKNQGQYVEFDSDFVTSEYIVAPASPRAKKNEQFLMEISTNGVSSASSMLDHDGTVLSTNNMSVHRILNQQKDLEESASIVLEGKSDRGLSSELRIGSIMAERGEFRDFEDGELLIESCTVKEENDLLEEAGGIVLEDGIVFEEPADSKVFDSKDLIEIGKVTTNQCEETAGIEIECNGAIESIVNQETESDGLSNDEAMLEISEMDFMDDSPPKKCSIFNDPKTLTFAKEGMRKRKMVNSNSLGRCGTIKITKLSQLS